MSEARIREIVRRFPENGIKLLLENPRNVHDLLRIPTVEVLDLIDFERLTLLRTTFVARDYRNVEADLVLRAPLRPRKGRRSRRTIWIYILIEHQSESDELMPLRLLDYVIQIFKHQVREWEQRYGSHTNIRLQPVLPVVFYTGTAPWESVGQLVDCVELGEHFRRVTPQIEDPVFLNLAVTPTERLESVGGHFGRVLRLIQQRKTRPEVFQSLVAEVVEQLESMPSAERLRWLELLSYIWALGYHERSREEQPGIEEAIEASLQTDEHRQEIRAMFRSAADVAIAKGRKEGRKEEAVRSRRQTLLLLLRKRFGEVPRETAAVIEKTKDIKQLEAWLERFATATTLEEIGIGPTT